MGIRTACRPVGLSPGGRGDDQKMPLGLKTEVLPKFSYINVDDKYLKVLTAAAAR